MFSLGAVKWPFESGGRSQLPGLIARKHETTLCMFLLTYFLAFYYFCFAFISPILTNCDHHISTKINTRKRNFYIQKKLRMKNVDIFDIQALH